MKIENLPSNVELGKVTLDDKYSQAFEQGFSVQKLETR